MFIKVCGMRDAENIREIEALGIDMMGFIFYPKSPRYVGEKAPDYLPKIRRVGVFVNEELSKVKTMVNEFGLSCVQLHGHETPEYCESLAKELPWVEISKAFSIGSAKDLKKTEDYEGKVSMYLFDTPTAGYGGSGKSFDWSVLNQYNGRTKFVLSGGIGPDDADAILSFSHPKCIGIDLNSMFETEPGKKDVDSLKAFLAELRA